MTTPISILTNNGQYFIVEGDHEDDTYNIGDHVYLDSDQDGMLSESDYIVSDHDEQMLRNFGIFQSGLYGRKISALRDYVSGILPVLKIKSDPQFASGEMPLSDDTEKWLYLEMVSVMDSARLATVSSLDYNEVYSMDYFDALHAGRTLYISQQTVKTPLPVQASILNFSGWFSSRAVAAQTPAPSKPFDEVYRESYIAELQMFSECYDDLDMTCVKGKAERMDLLADKMDGFDDVSGVVWSSSRQKTVYAAAARSELARAITEANEGENFSAQGFSHHISNAVYYASLGGNLDELSDQIDSFDYRTAYTNHFHKLKERAADYAHHKMYGDMDADLDAMERIGGRIVGESTKQIVSARDIERAKREVLAEIQ